jgi:hypothetical protein
MVPQNSHGQPPRSLSPEVEEQLTRALSALSLSTDSSPDPALQQAIAAAGREAKDRELNPEELILAFKRLEKRLDHSATGDDAARVAMRTKLIRALLEAYYTG